MIIIKLLFGGLYPFTYFIRLEDNSKLASNSVYFLRNVRLLFLESFLFFSSLQSQILMMGEETALEDAESILLSEWSLIMILM